MLSMMGIFGSFVGLGFILSALASFILSRRLGLLEGTGGAANPSVRPGYGPVDSSGL
jgi:hypothetical protein